MILKCNCKHEYQEVKYGNGNRLHTPKLVVQGKKPEYTCTVCGTKKTANESKSI